MTPKRLFPFGLAVFVLAAAATAQVPSDAIGPVEKQARPITPENPVPRRLRGVDPVYPLDAASLRASGRVTVRAVVDEFGRVAEVRRMRRPIVNSSRRPAPTPAELEVATEALVLSAADAVRQWQYVAPFDGPIAFNLSFDFSADRRVTLLGQEIAETVVVTNAPPPPPPAPGQPVRVGSGIRAPQQLRKVNPAYPQDARDARVQGVVILEALIGRDGRVTDAKVLRSIPMLDQAAIDAVRQWEYVPTMLNGMAVPVVMTVTVQFTLS